MIVNAKLAAVSFMLALVASPAFADSLCPSNAKQKQAETQLNQAEAAERAGHARAAYDAAARVDPDCVDERRVRALKKRAAKVLAVDAEKAGKLEEAFNWYQSAESPADADRMMARIFRGKPNDPNTFDRAQRHFTSTNNRTEVAELRAIATKNAERALAEEEAAFGQRRYGTEDLGRARDWERRAGNSERARERAERRGDALAADDLHRSLDAAMRYYRFAERRAKEKQVRDKAVKLAESYERKGQPDVAADYYRLAGATDKASTVEKRAAAESKQTEDNRRRKFDKDQKALEKELGM